MKNKFFPFIRPTKEESKDVWSNCIFTFDANILLNFYRYKAETTSTFFDLLSKLDERSFLTYQACQEYFDKRLEIISEQEKAYADMSTSLENSIEEPLRNSRRHPYISLELLEEFSGISKKMKEELNERRKEYSQRLAEDDILNRVLSIFDNKVSDPFSEEKLKEIYQDGENRFKLNIPPGFRDKSKGGVKQFGDLVLWLQIIELAKQLDKDVIFISDDEKEDWVLIHKGRKLGLLPDLQREFNALTGKRIYSYNSLRFLELGSQFYDTEVSVDTITDVRNLQTESSPIIEADLVWQSSARFNNGYSNKNFEKYGNEPIMAGSPLVVFWGLDWRFALVLHNNSSYPAYNIRVEPDSDVQFTSLTQLPKINNLPPFSKIELEAKTGFNIEGEHTEADAIVQERIPKHLEGLRLKITYLDEQRNEHETVVSIENSQLINTRKS